jgi:hypothetical protein
MIAHPFFHLKIARLNATLHRVRSSDPADFVTTRHLIHWWVLALRAIVGETVGISWSSQHDMPIDLKPGCSKISQNLLSAAYRAKPLGISRCDSHDIPMVTPMIVRMATVRVRCLVDARWSIFKQIKLAATISLGLNFCSMGSSQSPSRDTGPLKLTFVQG